MNHTIRFTQSQWETLQAGLWERGDVESGAIVLAEGMPGSGSASLAVRNVVLIPHESYRVRKADFMEVDPIWMNKQCFEARTKGLSVFTVHTHLADAPAWFSWADDAGDRRLMPALLAQIPDRPHGSLNVTRSDALARVFINGTFHMAQISVAGARVLVLPRLERRTGSKLSHARQQLALGRDGQARLATTRVGIVGLGGTGSVTSVLLGRLGISWLLLLDGDQLEGSNFSRVLESSRADIEASASKVKIAARAMLALNPSATVTAVERNLVTHDDLTALAACDVIFSCVDRLAPRALLNRVAYSAHVPVIDMGSAFRVDDSGKVISQGGKVVVIGPGRPCLWCWGDLDAERIRIESLEPSEREREAEHGYITGADEPQPSVVTFNTTLAAAAVTEFVRMVTAFAGSEAPPDRINFDFARGTATRARGRSRPGCRFCGEDALAAPAVPLTAGHPE